MKTELMGRIVTLTCPKHGEYEGETIWFEALGRELRPPCPICEEEHESAEREAAAERAKMDEERRIGRERDRFRRMNIGERYLASNLDNFEAYNAELGERLETCRGFAENPVGKLVMLGENGNGKTHLAVSILKKVGGVIYTAYEIGLRLRQAYNGEESEWSEWEVFNELCTVPLLVIDEVEKIKDSEAKHNWFSYVVGKRYDNLLPIVFIANCHTQNGCAAFRERGKPCPRCLEHHLENDVLSRIVEDGIVMNFSSGDYRKKIKERGGKAA